MSEKFEPKQNTFEAEQTKERLDLKKFLVKPKFDYREVIQKEYEQYGRSLEEWDEDSLFTEFGEMLAEHRFEALKTGEDVGNYEAELKLLKEKLAGGILIDLGSGGFFMSLLTNKLGVKAYISVDKFAGDRSLQLDPYVNLFQDGQDKVFKDIERIRVKDDMLDFIARVPQGSACVTISGIDKNIIVTEAYHAALAKEIVRVLKPGGIVFGTNSHCLDLLDPRKARAMKVEGSAFKFFEKPLKKIPS